MLGKARILSPSVAQFQVETWRPVEINEFDEMERLQSLKQRDNLIRGMGITDFVNRMLSGTPGTVATIPPAAATTTTINNNHTFSNNYNESTNTNNNYEFHGNAAIRPTISNNPNLNISATQNNAKFEIRQKTFNPFDAHAFYTENVIDFFLLLNFVICEFLIFFNDLFIYFYRSK